MKILVIHQHYLLPGQPGGSRFNEFARLWALAGHEVSIIAGTINYSTGYAPPRYHGRWVTRERDGDVTVFRAHVPQAYSRSYAGRMWAFFAFTLSSLSAIIRADRPDIVIATSPPLVTAIPAWLATRLYWRGVPWVFEIRDLWPESAVTSGVLKPGGLLTRFLYALEKGACRAADRINVLTPAFREDLLRRRLATDSKILFVPNGADDEMFAPGPRQNDVRAALGWGDRFVILYAGAHGKANALGQLIDAAEHLRDRPDVLIATVGDGPERASLEEMVRARGLTNIIFYGPQPKHKMPDFVNASDAGCAVLQDNPTFRTVYPNKVFDYMACERPTLLAIDGVARQLVCRDAQAGLFAMPENGRDIADRIRDLAGNAALRETLGRNGRRWVLEHASRKALAERYLSALAKLVERLDCEPTNTAT